MGSSVSEREEGSGAYNWEQGTIEESQVFTHTHTYEERCKPTTYSVLAIKTESMCVCFPHMQE